MKGFAGFKKYAVENGVHPGRRTIVALREAYEQHKGARWATIVALFKMQCALEGLKEHCAVMGYRI
jgi:hypothetical protein